MTFIVDKFYNSIYIKKKVVIIIKELKNKYTLVSLILLSIIFIFFIFSIDSFDDRLIINEIKASYQAKTSLNQQQIEKIESITKNKKYLSSEKNFMLGYLNLFVNEDKELAYKYFEKVIEKEKEKTTIDFVTVDFVKVYSYKFLAQKYLEENNIDKALKYTEKSLYSINPKNHGEYRNLINDIVRPVLDLKEGRYVMVKFLEYVLVQNYKHPDIQAEFYAYRTLQEFYLLQGNYYASTYSSSNAIKLAEQLNKQYFKGISLINLAKIYSKLEYYEKSINLLNQVKSIEAEDADWDDKLNLHRLRALYEVMINKKDYDSALKYINEFDNYKSNLEDEVRQDIDIVQNISIANILVKNNDLTSAQMYLDKAMEIMKIDKVVYWTDKDVFYYIVSGALNQKKGNYNLAIDEYKLANKLAIERSNTSLIKLSLNKLKSIHEKLEDDIQANKYNSQLNEVYDYEKQKNYERYMSFLYLRDEMESVKQESKRNEFINTILLFVVLLIAIIVSRFNIYPLVKYKKLKRKVKKYLYNNKYEVHYQPIVNPKEDKIVGFEGLLRLRLKDKLIMPYIIIDEIEKSNMMNEVSIWILRKIIEDYDILKSNKNISNKLYISMNTSLKEIEDDEFINEIVNIITESNLEKNSICIEVTENVGLNNVKKAQNNLLKLREAGFLVAIDDFGAQYSNFSIINTLPYDIVKLDKTFINDINESNLNKDVISFCDTLFGKKDKTIVIEGVEEINQVEFIKSTQSDKFYIQGYFYSKPKELKELINLKI